MVSCFAEFVYDVLGLHRTISVCLPADMTEQTSMTWTGPVPGALVRMYGLCRRNGPDGDLLFIDQMLGFVVAVLNASTPRRDTWFYVVMTNVGLVWVNKNNMNCMTISAPAGCQMLHVKGAAW